MIRIPHRPGAMAWFPALAFAALAAGAPVSTASGPGLPRAGARALGPVPVGAGADRLVLLGSASPVSRRISEARPARTRRCQGSGPQGLVAPAIVAVAPPAPPESPPQLEPPAACAQDPLDPCTRSPRPPPQA